MLDVMADNIGLSREPADAGDAAGMTPQAAEETETAQAEAAVAAGAAEAAVDVPAQEGRQYPVPELTKAFSQRLNARLDSEIAALGLVDPLTGQPVKSKKDLDNLHEKEKAFQASQSGTGNADIENEIQMLKSQLAGVERQSALALQDEALRRDPKFGEMYSANREAIRQLAESIDGLDLESAAMLFVRHNLDKITQQAQQRALNAILSKTSAVKNATPGSLSGGGEPQDNDIASMSAADFAAMVKRAEHGELRKQ